MAIWAIGDIQGCYEPLVRLLDEIRFDPARDRLWFTGDLVNRGPDSLNTLKLIRSLGGAALTVLGNHDLHLLAVAAGRRVAHRHDTFEEILDSPEACELLDWLRHQPLLHVENGWVLVHAGLAPEWDIPKARCLAGEVEAVLRGAEGDVFFAHMYGNAPDAWSDDLTGVERLRVVANILTRVRYCDEAGHCDFHEKGPPGTQPARLVPWFAVPRRRWHGARVVFGHWSTLGYYSDGRVYGLDSGCLWGGRLTALCLDGESPTPVSVSCPGLQQPGCPSAS